jgi:hypothetical protein
MTFLARAAIVALVFACLIGPARADDFDLPGLSRDAGVYLKGLTSRYPAGGTPAQRAAAERQAAAAAAAKDWAAEVTALETRAALGDATGAQWLELSAAAMRRVPADPQKALLAGWEAFQAADAGTDEVPPLLAIADALRALNRPAQVSDALAAALQRDPDNAAIKRQLADAQRASGMLVRRVRVEGETDPPRACVEFTVPPTRRADFAPADWVRLDPPPARRGGDARGRPPVHLRPALRRHHPGHPARRPASRE